MRVLLEPECAAVAGGHEVSPETAQGTKTILIASGAWMGFVVGGGIGILPGAAAGALANEAIGHYLSKGVEDEAASEEDEDELTQEELNGLFTAEYLRWCQQAIPGAFRLPYKSGPHQLVIDKPLG